MSINDTVYFLYGIYGISSEENKRCLRVALEALEKQIPKLVDMSHCDCGMALDNVWKYCPNCGQALKWGGAE